MRAILFDFGGTLDADGVTWLERFHAIYKEEGIPSSREQFDRAFYASDDDLAKRFKLADLGLEETLLLQAQCVLETLAPGRADARDRLVEAFLRGCREHFLLNRPFLGRLRRDFRLGIVSNFYGNINSVLDGEGLLEFFDVIADSGVVGAEKPAPAIFLHAIRELGSTPEDSLMVGDSIRRDMRGAEALGMPHALVTKTPQEPCCPKAWVLSTVRELESRLAAEPDGPAVPCCHEEPSS